MCACGDADDEDLQKKAVPGQTEDFDAQPEAMAGVQAALRSPGRPLEPGTRSFMEDRFGINFSQVHIHDDPLAARSARDVNALAYTVGQEVVFGAGQYAPGTDSGRRLLAHELAHTIQQDSGTHLRRKEGSLAVKGLYEDRGGAKEKNFIYFDLDSPGPGDNPPESVLEADERTKIENQTREALAAKVQEISLYGFASEEGGPATNNPLIQRRMSVVQNVINDVVQKAGGTAIQVHMNNRLSCGTDKYDYRYWRVVEIQSGKTPQTRLCASPKATSCPPDRMTELAKIRASSLQLLEGPKGVISRLERYIHNPADEPDVAAALDQFFAKDHSAKTADDVRKRMVAIRDFIRNLDSGGRWVSKCGSEDEFSCHAGAEAATDTDAKNVVFCPKYFDQAGKKLGKEGALIHEFAHGSEYATDDRAYQWERGFPILSTKAALDNADLLEGFVMQLSGGYFEKGPEHEDVVTGCDTGQGTTNKESVQKAMALAQRWNLDAVDGTADTYDKYQYRAYMAPEHIRYFGRSDKATIAGLYDKYSAMHRWFKLFYNIRCAQPGDAACPGSRPVQWNLTHPASSASGGPVHESVSDTSSLTPGSAAESKPGTTTTTPAPLSGTATESQSNSTPSSGMPGTAAPSGGSAQTASAASPGAAAGNITVCPSFFTNTLKDQVVEMHSGLAIHLPGVTEATSRSYALMALEYRKKLYKKTEDL